MLKRFTATAGDALLKFDKSSKAKVEVSANEWKRLIVRDETKIK